MKIHPYALIIGFVIGVMVLFMLRHPLFALFAGVLSILGFDIAFKSKVGSGKNDPDA